MPDMFRISSSGRPFTGEMMSRSVPDMSCGIGSRSPSHPSRLVIVFALLSRLVSCCSIGQSRSSHWLYQYVFLLRQLIYEERHRKQSYATLQRVQRNETFIHWPKSWHSLRTLEPLDESPSSPQDRDRDLDSSSLLS